MFNASWDKGYSDQVPRQALHYADKQQRIAGMVNNALLTQQASRNYEQNASQQENQNLQIR